MDSLERSRELFLELVGCEIWGRDISIELFERGERNWSQVLTVAHEQAMLGVVANSIARLPVALQPGRETYLKLHHLATLNRQQYHYQAQVLGDIMADMRRVGVARSVILKGLGVTENYPDPSSRMCGDIDLWVGDDMYRRALEICADPRVEDTPMHCEFRYKDVPLELHRSVTSGEEIDRHSRELVAWLDKRLLDASHLKQVEICGTTVETPDATFNAIYIFLHAYRHLVKGGIGIRQICDWALVLDKQHEEIDYEIVERTLHRHNMRKMWDIFIRIIERYLGFDTSTSHYPLRYEASEESVQEVMEVIMTRGNFGQYANRGRYSKIYIVKQLQTLVVRFRELGFLMRIDCRRGLRTMRSLLVEGFTRIIKRFLGAKQ